ncbi:MAG: N-acetylmuramoyl-L-alanine amidase [Roseiflexaceae bacterium]
MLLVHLRRYWGLGLLAIPLLFAAAAFRAPWPAVHAPQAPPAVVAAVDPVAAAAAAAPVVDVAAAAPPISAPPSPPQPAVASESAATPTPSVEPTPTPRPAGTPPRVGLQVGHWKSNELPEELARLRTSTGARAAGYTEAEVNLDIAQRVAALLEQHGVVVDMLPATVPMDYDADVFISIHADGSQSAGARGFKIATPWRASRAAQHLLDTLRAEYDSATGLPWDDAITFNMRGYYAFNYRRHQHAVARTTPAVIVEMGFLTSATDRATMIGQPDRIAAGIANGIIRYLNERDPNDGAALLPPEFRSQRPLDPGGVDVRTAPRDDAPLLLHADADQRFNPLLERDGWYQVFIRNGQTRTTGWVRKDQLTTTNDPTPTLPPATDS